MWFCHVQDGLGCRKKKINIVIILINSEITYYYIYFFFFLHWIIFPLSMYII